MPERVTLAPTLSKRRARPTIVFGRHERSLLLTRAFFVAPLSLTGRLLALSLLLTVEFFVAVLIQFSLL
jgi:hypothetical protein